MDSADIGDVDAFVFRSHDLGVRPGVTLRPLQWLPEMPREWQSNADAPAIDPTHPYAAEHISESVADLARKGVELIRIAGTGPALGTLSLRDSTRSTTEIGRETYERIRGAAGQAYVWAVDPLPDAAVGLFELNEPTSDGLLDRVNHLAFRGAANGVLTGEVPGIVDLNGSPSQAELDFLLLVGLSGSPLFVDLEPAAVKSHEWSILKSALDAAAVEEEQAEPVDWFNSTAPQKWRLPGGRRQFDWSGPDGVVPDFN
jgi:alpha-galactosidase